MPIYWSFASIPELSPLTPAERRRVWRRGALRALLRPLPLAVLLAASLLTSAVTVLLVIHVRPPVLAIFLMFGFALAWGFAYAQWLAERARPHLREIVAASAVGP